MYRYALLLKIIVTDMKIIVNDMKIIVNDMINRNTEVRAEMTWSGPLAENFHSPGETPTFTSLDFEALLLPKPSTSGRYYYRRCHLSCTLG